MSPIANYVMQTGLTLVGVLLLGGVLIYVSRRLGGGPKEGPLRLMARLPLEGRRSIYIVRAADRVLVLGGSEAGLTKLAELENLPNETASQRSPAGFAEVLGRLSRPDAAQSHDSSAQAGPNATAGAPSSATTAPGSESA